MEIKKKLIKFQNTFFFFILERNLIDCDTVLDVGCGHSSPLGQIKKNFQSEGIEIYQKTLMLSKKNKTHDKYTLGDIRKLKSIYKNKSFDACVNIDVIEHFTKKESLRLIENMESIAKKKVIILTPNGFLEQHAYDGNPHQEHKSGWKKKDLENLGYTVYGMRGLKYLRNENAGIRFRPWILWGFLSFISEIIFFPFPDVSFDIIAIKKLNIKE